MTGGRGWLDRERRVFADSLDRLTLIAVTGLRADRGWISLMTPFGLRVVARSWDAGPVDLAEESPLVAIAFERGEASSMRVKASAGSGGAQYAGRAIRKGIDGQVLGVVSVERDDPAGWKEADLELLGLVADSAATELAAIEVACELEAANHELHEVRAELEAERVQLREIIRQAPAFIAAVEGNASRITMANRPFYDLVGPRDLIGRRLSEAVPELAGSGLMRAIGVVAERGEALSIHEERIVLGGPGRGQRSERFVSLVIQPLIGAEWKPIGVLILGIDLTQQVQARRAAEAAVEDFRQMAATVRQVFWTATHDGSRILYVSPAFEEVWGRSRDEVRSRAEWLDTVVEEDRERVSIASTPERLMTADLDIEYRILRPDGEVRWVRTRSFPVWGEAGAVSRLIGIAEDVTDRHVLEMQLRQSQKMEAIGRLAGGIAHDFNNMLTAITGHAQMLEADLPPSSPLVEHLEVIQMAADRSARLTRQLLAFSRRQLLQPQVVGINAIVEGIEPLLRRVIGEDIRIRCELATGLAPVHADPSQIEQVMMNLAVNARDAMPGGGDLFIATSFTEIGDSEQAAFPEGRRGRYAVLSVQDTGLGMDAGTRARIFEPFFTTKPVGKGTGLGLSTVYGIIRQTEGMIRVQSEPDKGTRFDIYLPLHEEESVDRPEADHRAVVAPDSATILLVEDDPAVRGLVTRILGGEGHTVLLAEDGSEATKIATSHIGRIDLLLTDVVLPTLGGRAVADQVTSRHPETRVLYMSGYTDEALGDSGILEAAAQFIEKPFTPSILVERVNELLGRGGPGERMEA